MSPLTAVIESYQEFFKYGFTRASIKPRVMIGLKIKSNTILDLTDTKIRRKLGFTIEDLIHEDWQGIQESGEESWTQAIGRGAYLAGFTGLIAPSAQDPREKNIIIFPQRINTADILELLEKDELPPHS